MSEPYYFQYRFHPAGQGLFASGEILGNDKPLFRWVYDCGTSSPQTLLEKGLDALLRHGEELDLVTLSHFDKDHISGVSELVKRFKIKTLLLPYMALWERLLLSFDQASGAGPIEFYISPSAFLTGLPNARIQNVVFVPPGGEGPIPKPNPSSGPPGSAEWHMRVPEQKPDDLGEFNSLVDRTNAKTALLDRGQPITLQGFWEFVPYNENAERQHPDAFREAVENEKRRILDAGSKKRRNNALRALKRIYVREFGGSSRARNAISVFLYAGPIYESWQVHEFHQPPCNICHYVYPERIDDMVSRPMPFSRDGRCSILYSGDGFLDSSDRLGRLKAYLGRGRMERVGVFQVMHHGAEGNWHGGVAQAISPTYSVFSSDPDHRGFAHPSAVVLRDFWKFNPVQVNRSEARFGGLLLQA